MRNIRFIIIIAVNFLTLHALSQDYHFSGLLPGYIFSNPSYAAVPSTPELAATYRNQWPGSPATFVTYGAAFVMPVAAMNSGIGINVLNDIQGDGVISRTYAGLLYGYGIDLNREWRMGMGVGVSYVFKNFDAGTLVFRSDILNELGYGYSSVVLEDYSMSYPDFSLGLTLTNTLGFQAGLSVNHLTRPHESANNMMNDRLPMRYSGYITTRINQPAQYSKMSLVFEPGLFYSKQGNNQELIWGMQTVLSSSFVFGAWLRQNLKFNYDAVIFSVGILKEKYNFLYSYDVNVKKLQFLSTKMGAHEVTFLYRLEYNRKNKGAVECPAY